MKNLLLTTVILLITISSMAQSSITTQWDGFQIPTRTDSENAAFFAQNGRSGPIALINNTDRVGLLSFDFSALTVEIDNPELQLFNVTTADVPGNNIYVIAKQHELADDVAPTWQQLNLDADLSDTVVTVATDNDDINTLMTFSSEELSQLIVDTKNSGKKLALILSSDGATIKFENSNQSNVPTISFIEGTPIPVTGVSLDDDAETFDATTTYQLSATVSPAEASDKTITWSSDNEAVATVAEGLITGVTEGTANITVTTTDGGFTATFLATIEAVKPVTSVSLDDDAETFDVGSTYTLTATIEPTNATNQNVSWSSSDESVATVDNGVVTGVSVGSATITVTTEDGGLTADFQATVQFVPATAVELSDDQETIEVGDQYTLMAIITPQDATNQNVIWSSSDDAIATVEDGVVTGITVGTATITVTTEDGGFTDTFEATVEPARPSIAAQWDGFQIPNRSNEDNTAFFAQSGRAGPIALINGDERVGVFSFDFSNVTDEITTPGFELFNVTTVDVSSTNIYVIAKLHDTPSDVAPTWLELDLASDLGDTVLIMPTTSEDINTTMVLESDMLAAKITEAKNAGEKLALTLVTDGATLKFENSNQDNPPVIKYEAGTPISVTGITLDDDMETIAIGSVYTLNPEVTPYEASNKMVSWSSSDDAVATVDNGKVSGIAGGTATITATTADGGFTATFSATVDPAAVAVTSLSLDSEADTITVGDTFTLNAVIEPENATIKSVIWESSNEEIATVNEGVVTGVAPGNASITATSVDGGFVAEFAATIESVNVPVTGIALSDDEETIEVGLTYTLTATVTPEDATNQNVIWTSDDQAIATVEEGVVSGVSEGSATITATTEDGGFTATFIANVAEASLTTLLPIWDGFQRSQEAVQDVDTYFAQNGRENISAFTREGEETRIGVFSFNLATIPEDAGTVEFSVFNITTNELTVTDLILYAKQHDLTLNTAPTWAKLDLSTSFGDSVAATTITDETQNSRLVFSSPQLAQAFNAARSAGRQLALILQYPDRPATIFENTTTENKPFIRYGGTPAAVTGVTISAETDEVAVGNTLALTAIITPENAINQNVTWTSSDENIAIVSEDGLVAGISEGEATITVNTEDGDFTSSFVVKVIAAAPLSADPLGERAILVFPNPASRFVQFTEVVQAARIFTLDGKMIKNKTISNRMTVIDLKKGIYIVEAVLTSGETVRSKLIIE